MPSLSLRLGSYLLLLSLLAGTLVGLSHWHSTNATAIRYDELAHEMGRVFFKQLVITRRWTAKQGGVYVPITDEIQPNPHLIDAHRDVVTTDGLALTKVNPAYLTRLLSAMTEDSDGVSFRITSLKPLNPDNAPDDWERLALEQFEQGAEEYAGLVMEPGGRAFRFMGRLMTERSCLQCHADQGYQLNDVRGGIRISVPWTAFQSSYEATLRESMILHGAALAGALILLWGGGLVVLHRSREVEALNCHMRSLKQRLETSALTDSLTGIANRMHFDRILETAIAQARRHGTSLTLIMFDLDHFKNINDVHGHAVGDQVLQAFARVTQASLRSTDLLARWGGEEFMVAAPHTDLDLGVRLAERIRSEIESHAFPVVGRLTVSAGVTTFQRGDSELSLLKRADTALYLAKQRGRNQIAADTQT